MTGHFWLKLKHGAPANPKWRMIAQRVGCPQGEVWTLYSWALDFAGQHGGSLAGFDLEEVAATTDYLLDELKRIWAAFVDKAIVIGEALHNWVEHQVSETVKRVSCVSCVSTKRVQRFRKRQKDARQREFYYPIQGGRPDETDETHETPDKRRERDSLSESSQTLPHGGRAEGNTRDSGRGRRADGTNPRARGTNPRAQGTNPRALAEQSEEEANRRRDREALDYKAQEYLAGRADFDRFARQQWPAILRRAAEIKAEAA